MNALSTRRAAIEAIRSEFEASRNSRIWTDYVNALRLVSQVVFTRSSGFVLEFIQNAEDAGQGLSGKGEILISINKQRLKFVHNGRPFDDSNLGAICGIRSSKKPERGTLGYLGIGFKSVFKIADRVEVYSNGYQFKFDRNHHEWSSNAADTPWH
jgi:HSP90 family molecular chaperone